MSSPIHQQNQQFLPHLLSNSPLKPGSYYFQSDDLSQQFIYNDRQDELNPLECQAGGSGAASAHDDDFIVPVSQNANFSTSSSTTGQLKFPPKLIQQPQFSASAPPSAAPGSSSIYNNDTQANLFPPLEFTPVAAHQQLPESISSSTIDSMPYLTSSVSDSSITTTTTSTTAATTASPISFQNMMTPRNSRNRRLSVSLTPLTNLYQTPLQQQHNQHNQQQPLAPIMQEKSPKVTSASTKIAKHRRTRSRLSLDANGCASIVTLGSHKKSVSSPSNNGTNPFYTPPTFLSTNSPVPTTPLKTPSSSINLGQLSSLNLASLGSSTAGFGDFDNFESISPQMLLSHDQLASAEQHHHHHHSQQHHHSHHSHAEKSTIDIINEKLTKSQSSINLAALTLLDKNDPYSITKFDILQPRERKFKKSKSTNSIDSEVKKNHKCPICDKAFQRPEHVKRHMRSHSSDKPYECDEAGCCKKFNRADNLKAHLRKFHNRNV